MTTGFMNATKQLATTRMAAMRTKGRATIVNSRARTKEAKAAKVINRAIRSFLDWLHQQPWYGISKDLLNPVMTQHVVRSKARRAAAERVIGKCLSKWANTRVPPPPVQTTGASSSQGQQTLNRVRRKMAIFKIQKLVVTVTSRKRRPYQYQLLVRLMMCVGVDLGWVCAEWHDCLCFVHWRRTSCKRSFARSSQRRSSGCRPAETSGTPAGSRLRTILRE